MLSRRSATQASLPAALRSAATFLFGAPLTLKPFVAEAVHLPDVVIESCHESGRLLERAAGDRPEAELGEVTEAERVVPSAERESVRTDMELEEAFAITLLALRITAAETRDRPRILGMRSRFITTPVSTLLRILVTVAAVVRVRAESFPHRDDQFFTCSPEIFEMRMISVQIRIVCARPRESQSATANSIGSPSPFLTFSQPTSPFFTQLRANEIP